MTLEELKDDTSIPSILILSQGLLFYCRSRLYNITAIYDHVRKIPNIHRRIESSFRNAFLSFFPRSLNTQQSCITSSDDEDTELFTVTALSRATPHWFHFSDCTQPAEEGTLLQPLCRKRLHLLILSLSINRQPSITFINQREEWKKKVILSAVCRR